MSKLKLILESLSIPVEDANALLSRFESLREDQKEFLENNPGRFRSVEKIEAYISERENSSNKNTLTGFNSSLPEKSYSAIEATVGILKVFFWIAVVVVFLIGGIVSGFNFFFWAAALPASLIALLVYAQIQLLEAFVNTAKNTNKTNTLLDINNQLLTELVKQKK